MRYLLDACVFLIGLIHSKNFRGAYQKYLDNMKQQDSADVATGELARRDFAPGSVSKVFVKDAPHKHHHRHHHHHQRHHDQKPSKRIHHFSLSFFFSGQPTVNAERCWNIVSLRSLPKPSKIRHLCEDRARAPGVEIRQVMS